MGNNSTTRRMITGVRESNGGGVTEVGVAMVDVNPAKTPRLNTSGSDTSGLEGREMEGSRVGSSRGSLPPNNSANVGTTTGANFPTIIYPSASASTSTISGIKGGQVEAKRTA